MRHDADFGSSSPTLQGLYVYNVDAYAVLGRLLGDHSFSGPEVLSKEVAIEAKVRGEVHRIALHHSQRDHPLPRIAGQWKIYPASSGLPSQ